MEVKNRVTTLKRLAARDAAAWCLVLAAGIIPLAAANGTSFPTVSPDQVAAWQERGEAFLLVDTRPQAVFDLKHARGAINVPAFALSAKPLPRGAKVVLYDAGAGSAEAEQAAKALQAKGHPEFYVLEGGLTGWEARGLPIVAPPGESAMPFTEPVAAEDLMRLIDAGTRVTILDLRAADVYRQSRVPGAVLADTDVLVDRAVAGLSPSDLIVLYDDGSGDVRGKAESLRRRGFRAVKYLHGGMLAWYEKNLRVER